LPLQTRTGLGILLALCGGFLISIDIPIIRLAESNPWVVMFMRGIGLSSILGLILVFRKNWTDTPDNPLDNAYWVEVGILYGISSILFTLSVFYTSTANLVFILAFNPMIAALFAWWLIGERPDRVTWMAVILTVAGVSIIVGDGLKGGTWFGDMTSLGAATVLAYSLTRTRQSGLDMSLSGCLGGAIAALFALPLVIANFEMPTVPAWLIFNVFVLVPAAGFTLSLAPRFIPAPQVAMFFLLETILAPIWVWLIFAETPSDNTLIGGAIVLCALTGHSIWQLKKG